ncbi:hypothetical protein CENSYa_1293 [Cenarchaeum symbiosum A]|uniref:Uncharacterized protein n=1 Tax=Cenarchaeum symbiosum (strain A) TaxID=414004 RepID=A0RX49_CENSY|nr:hypothetical protein CENSYa_1293 [Cenarchaeum symbiosum A]
MYGHVACRVLKARRTLCLQHVRSVSRAGPRCEFALLYKIGLQIRPPPRLFLSVQFLRDGALRGVPGLSKHAGLGRQVAGLRLTALNVRDAGQRSSGAETWKGARVIVHRGVEKDRSGHCVDNYRTNTYACFYVKMTDWDGYPMRPIPKSDEERIRMMQEIVHSGIKKMHRVRFRFYEEEFIDQLKGIMHDLKDLHTMEQELKKMRKMLNAMESERQKDRLALQN